MSGFVMAVYNRGMERKPEFKEIERKPLKEREPLIKESFIDEDIHNEIVEQINTLKTKSDLDHFRDTLRIALRTNLINDDNFKFYSSKAEQRVNILRKKEDKKQEKKEATYNLNSSSSVVKENDDAKKEKETEDRKKLVRGEAEEVSDKKIEQKSAKYAKLKKVWEVVKSPFGRVLAFVFLGIILLFYLTKSSAGEALNSPIFLIAAVLIIILIVGRGGKTRLFERKSE